MAKILCIEDGSDMNKIVDAVFKNEHVTFAVSLQSARRYLKSGAFDLLIMDVQLPDGGGLDLMAETLQADPSVPVILMTSQDDLATKAAAFALGAEDFVTKPFHPLELKMRVEAKLRKRERMQVKALRIGHLICNLDEQRVENRITGDLIEVTALEFKILALLTRTPSKIFARSEIISRVWSDGVSVTDRAVDVHISNLRKKISGAGAHIEGVIGIGYRIHAIAA